MKSKTSRAVTATCTGETTMAKTEKKKPGRKPDPDGSEVIQLRYEPAERARWEKLASRDGLRLSTWIKLQANRAGAICATSHSACGVVGLNGEQRATCNALSARSEEIAIRENAHEADYLGGGHVAWMVHVLATDEDARILFNALVMQLRAAMLVAGGCG